MRFLALLLISLLAACAALPPSAIPAAVEVPRENIMLASALSVDAANNRVTLPLFKGEVGGKTVWYIVTDSSDRADAMQRGVVHAPLLARAGLVAQVSQRGDATVFPAAPDFSPARRYVAAPGKDFPPASVQPGAVARPGYTPFVRFAGQDAPVLNAPIMAVGEGPFDLAGHGDVMDRVLAIDTARRTVTLLLSRGFAEGKRVLYISTDASDPAAAVLERATYVPGLDVGDADIGLLVMINGRAGRDDIEVQGLDYFIGRGGMAQPARFAQSHRLDAPGNILTAIPRGPTASGYSPLWSISMLQWSAAAKATGQDRRQTDQAAIYRLLQQGALSGPGGAPLAPAGFVVNCPVIAILD
ncbi:hypothetical protein [Ferrovibrio sp.]|uniref:hypothetical protein n=1 Tax=Ferrovibrio sp. TaxID=1917215 RepID=UPI0025B82B74|nr:hypothetical protein [Ferrovibrio sp.]MBX3456370.1 hypothetical protein [Ferrovibrio sp.]